MNEYIVSDVKICSLMDQLVGEAAVSSKNITMVICL